MEILLHPDPAALDAAADLHRAALPESTISKLGPAYTRSFYRFAVSSDLEEIFVARLDDGEIAGAAVLSFNPAGLSRRLALRTPMLLNLACRPTLALTLVSGLLSRAQDSRAGDEVRALPEVIAIFVHEAHRNRDVGKELLHAIEDRLRGHGIHRYIVRTIDRADNRAIGFYEREGFEKISKIRAHGTWFQLMAKNVSPAN